MRQCVSRGFRGGGGGGGGGSVKVARENMITDLTRCRINQNFQISVKSFRATSTCARNYSAPIKETRETRRDSQRNKK